jgi:hypothetical protein
MASTLQELANLIASTIRQQVAEAGTATEYRKPLDKEQCWRRCQAVAEGFHHLGLADICGKCAIGPCSFEPAVPG